MPWSHTSPMDQNTPCIAESLRDRLSVTARCALSGVRRKTGSQWMDRDLIHGPQGLEERSHRPSPAPRLTPDQVVAAILDARSRHPSWGAQQRVAILSTGPPRGPWPARSTVCDLRSRHGWVPTNRKRRALGPPGKPTRPMGAPHDVWSADCTGPFQTGDGRSGSPLTLTAGDSRVLLACPALSSTSGAAATPVCTRVCNACGWPQRIRTDHGGPFATTTLARLSPLSAWWGRLGRVPACIEPGTPQPNGRHARRPRPLKAAATRPPGANLRAPPQPCNHCRDAFNPARPHEALDMRTPTAGSAPSPRAMPHTRPPLEYPDRFEVRSVSATGGLRWNRHWVNGSSPCAGASVGLEDIDEGVWNVSCGPLQLGRRLERSLRIADASGRLTRHR